MVGRVAEGHEIALQRAEPLPDVVWGEVQLHEDVGAEEENGVCEGVIVAAGGVHDVRGLRCGYLFVKLLYEVENRQKTHRSEVIAKRSIYHIGWSIEKIKVVLRRKGSIL